MYLGFNTTLDVDDGIRELLFALKTGLIRNPTDEKYRNAQFIVQYVFPFLAKQSPL